MLYDVMVLPQQQEMDGKYEQSHYNLKTFIVKHYLGGLINFLRTKNTMNLISQTTDKLSILYIALILSILILL